LQRLFEEEGPRKLGKQNGLRERRILTGKIIEMYKGPLARRALGKPLRRANPTITLE
jgi:hypothetical protein